MKKIVTILIIGVLGWIGYFGFQMYLFAGGVVEDSKRMAQFHENQKYHNGDIIFQTSKSSQSKAIQLATHSKYSHMGIIYQIGADFFVFEAVQPVKLTKLSDWKARGKDGHFVVKRLKNANEVLTTETLSNMKTVGDRFKGKNYDLYFEWTDDEIYCSELVWKIYFEATGIKIGELENLSDFDLTDRRVKQKMKERYGSDVPMNEKVISPKAMFDSIQLITVESN